MSRTRFSASTGSAKVVESSDLPACFGGSPEGWMHLQAAYDLKKSEQNKKVRERVAESFRLTGEWWTKW